VFAVSGTYSHRSNVAAQHDRERGPACTHVEHAHPSQNLVMRRDPRVI
jgi:hypothetical protein